MNIRVTCACRLAHVDAGRFTHRHKRRARTYMAVENNAKVGSVPVSAELVAEVIDDRLLRVVPQRLQPRPQGFAHRRGQCCPVVPRLRGTVVSVTVMDNPVIFVYLLNQGVKLREILMFPRDESVCFRGETQE